MLGSQFPFSWGAAAGQSPCNQGAKTPLSLENQPGQKTHSTLKLQLPKIPGPGSQVSSSEALEALMPLKSKPKPLREITCFNGAYTT